jgi:hypothetical protein
MTAWAFEIEEVTPRLRAILLGNIEEVDVLTCKRTLVGYGREPLVLVGFWPFSFLSACAAVWISPTKFACGRDFQLRRECIRLGREYLSAQRWKLFAEIEPGDKTARTFARVFGFEDRGIVQNRLVMELPKC